MTPRKIKIASLLSIMMMGMMSTALPAATTNYSVVKNQVVEKEWTLLGTKDGVSCYYRLDELGTGNGVYLRFVNNSGANVDVNWTVNVNENKQAGKLTVAPGQTISSSTEPALAIRIATGEPVISFTVSK